MGDGSCPPASASERLEYKGCNPQACVHKTGAATLRCGSMLDVILLLDGSGSLGEPGWQAMKRTAEMLVEAMDFGATKVKMAVQLFSGPKNVEMYHKCTDSTLKTSVNMETDCGLKWISHLSTEVQVVTNKVSQMQWPATSTFTSAALSMAEAEFLHGRPDAQRLVIVITDGKPMSLTQTQDAADSLRKRARLMWVPVTKWAPIKDLELWASPPIHDNLIEVEGFSTLEQVATVDKIIGSMCPTPR